MSRPDLGGILQAMYDEHKKLTPDLVLKEASDPKHPLHHRFEWDDSVAAHKHRLSQAGGLIRSVRVVYAERPDGSPKSVRAFVAPVRGEGYRAIEEVAADPMAMRLLLSEAEREAKRFRARYGHLKEYADIVAGMQEAG